MSGEALGAVPRAGGSCTFNVWAPLVDGVSVELVDSGRRVALDATGRGYFSATLPDVLPGQRYFYVLPGDRRRPDPASRCQPEGVHGPSAVVSLDVDWTDAAFCGRPLADQVIYELHVGTFSEAGTFAGVIGELERLVDLGITTIELMPIAEFPGRRNWGYDGVLPFAVQSSYGGVRGLSALVDACHHRGISVIVDVVYNHLGPEGNYLGDYAPYFTDRHRTPWGSAFNVDGHGSDEVRRYFVDNAIQWLRDFHVDGLRLDAVHEIHDRRAVPFLEELALRVQALSKAVGRPLHLIAECDTADPRLVQSRDQGGFELDAVWCDDFHHAVHALLTGERNGYYVDFGRLEDLASAWRRGLSRPGQYSRHRGARHGRAEATFADGRATVCVQNHDQVGNRLLGERLSHLVDFESQKLAAALVMLSPHVPLIFMGQEYAEPAPFQYFVDHGDDDLIEAVRQGRKLEFASFGYADAAPDPNGPEVFERSRLTPECRSEGEHALLAEVYRELADLRRRHAPTEPDRVVLDDEAMVMRVDRNADLVMVFHFGSSARPWSLPPGDGRFAVLWRSSDARFVGSAREEGAPAPVAAGDPSSSGRLAPRSCTLYARRA